MKEIFVFNIFDYIYELTTTIVSNFNWENSSILSNLLIIVDSLIYTKNINIYLLDEFKNFLTPINLLFINDFETTQQSILINILYLYFVSIFDSTGYTLGSGIIYFISQIFEFFTVLDRTFLFFFFGLLFFLSTVFSFVFISYLGLYGVFKLNIITLFLFWLSVLFNFNSFVLDNTSVIIKVGR